MPGAGLASFPLHHIWPQVGLLSMFPDTWNINSFSSSPGPRLRAVEVSSAAARRSRYPSKRAPPGHCHRVIMKQPMLATLTLFTAYKINRYPAPTPPHRAAHSQRQVNQILPYFSGPAQFLFGEKRSGSLGSSFCVCVPCGSSPEPSPLCSLSYLNEQHNCLSHSMRSI